MLRSLIVSLALALPAVAAADYTGNIEFLAGFGVGAEVKPDGGKATDMSDFWSSVALGIVPGLDKMLGKSVGIGGEMGFWWFSPDDKIGGDSQLVLSPHLRARMSFPIVDKITFDGLLGVGPSIWTSRELPGTQPDTDTRFGWSLRFNFGGSYAINDQVSAFLNVGYYTTTTYGDDMTANLYAIPVGVGVRGGF